MSGNVWRVMNNDGIQYFLQRCPSCDRENYAMNVAIGICTWCGHEASDKDIAPQRIGNR